MAISRNWIFQTGMIPRLKKLDRIERSYSHVKSGVLTEPQNLVSTRTTRSKDYSPSPCSTGCTEPVRVIVLKYSLAMGEIMWIANQIAPAV